MRTRLAVLLSVALVASLVVLVTDDSGRGDEPVAEATRIPIQTDDMTTWPEVSWEEAVERLEECRVREAGQTHAGKVFLTMKDSRHVWAQQPALDDLLGVLLALDGVCPPIPFWTE